MTTVAFLVVIASLVALLVVGTEDMGRGHVVFANGGIDVQTSTTQDQGCVPAGGTSGITNACTATSTPGSTQTTVTVSFGSCNEIQQGQFTCTDVISCDSIGCTSMSCTGYLVLPSNCVTNNGVQLTSCLILPLPTPPGSFSCKLTEPGTGITQSGGVTGDAG